MSMVYTTPRSSLPVHKKRREGVVKKDYSLELTHWGLGRFQNRARKTIEGALERKRISPRAISSFIPTELLRDRERFSVVITLIYGFLASQQIIVTADKEALDDYGTESEILKQEKERTQFRKKSSNRPRLREDIVTENLPEDTVFLDDEHLFGYTTPNSYFVRLKWIPLLTAEQEQELGMQIAEGDIRARDKLITHNLRLVVWVARRYVGWKQMELDDLIQEGNLGLLTAAEKYNWQRGRFTTYAMWWIRQAITRAIADQRTTIRIPVHVREVESKIYANSIELSNELGREPTVEEIAQRTNIPAEKIEWIRDIVHSTNSVSLDAEIDSHSSKKDRDGGSLEELVYESESELIGPALYLEAKEELALARQKVTELLDIVTFKLGLSERNRAIFKHFYGFDRTGKRHTLQAVGMRFHVSRERIRQIVASIWRTATEYGLDMDHDLLRSEMTRIRELERFTAAAVS